MRLSALLLMAMYAHLMFGTPGQASDSGTCVLTITLSFSGAGVSATPTPRTLAISSSPFLMPKNCVGTGIALGVPPTLTALGGIGGGPSASTTMSCHNIVVGGLGTWPFGNVSYDGMIGGGMAWTYVGTVGGGTIVFKPAADTVVGVAVGAELGTSLANCELGGSITSVTLTGAMTLVKV